jgi:hypothetical protein
MTSSSGRGEKKWLRDFIAGAINAAEPADLAPSTPPESLSWVDLAKGMLLGESVGPYQVGDMLGRGGVGVVFQEFDSTLCRPVAIKFLSPRLASSTLARVRFIHEARAAAAINHPNVVTIHAIGEHEGLPYLVMEYVDGITLASRLERDGMLERKSVLRIGLQLARGLAAAHEQGLVHRDVKPGNILLEGGLWLRSITIHRVRRHWRDQRPSVKQLSDARDLEDPRSELSRLWDSEHDRHVVRTLLEKVRPEFDDWTWGPSGNSCSAAARLAKLPQSSAVPRMSFTWPSPSCSRGCVSRARASSNNSASDPERFFADVRYLINPGVVSAEVTALCGG